jgi:hypothetical protein
VSYNEDRTVVGETAVNNYTISFTSLLDVLISGPKLDELAVPTADYACAPSQYHDIIASEDEIHFFSFSTDCTIENSLVNRRNNKPARRQLK